MWNAIATGVAIVLCAAISLAAAQEDVPEVGTVDLFSDCGNSAALPPALKETYTEFALAAPEGMVEPFCLPHAVPITTKVRLDAATYRGISLPFLRTQFAAAVLSATKESEDCYSIRTATTVLNFVHTKAGHWRIYPYADKPIL